MGRTLSDENDKYKVVYHVLPEVGPTNLTDILEIQPSKPTDPTPYIRLVIDGDATETVHVSSIVDWHTQNVDDDQSIAIFEWWNRTRLATRLLRRAARVHLGWRAHLVRRPQVGESTTHRAKKPKAVLAYRTSLDLAPLRTMIVREEHQSTHVASHAELQSLITKTLGVENLTAHHMNVAVNHIEVSVNENPPDDSLHLPNFRADESFAQIHVYIPQPSRFHITVYKHSGTPTVVKLTVNKWMLQIMMPKLLTLHRHDLARVKDTGDDGCEVILYPNDDATEEIVSILHTNANSFLVKYRDYTDTNIMATVLGQIPPHNGPESRLGMFWHPFRDEDGDPFPEEMIEEYTQAMITLNDVLPDVNPATVYTHRGRSYVSMLPRLTFNITEYECLTWAVSVD